jgi:hypothetical protein
MMVITLQITKRDVEMYKTKSKEDYCV